MMTSLQQSLQQRHEVLTATMDPIDSPRIVKSIRKLKIALRELHTRNAQLVMRNEKLNIQLSFMPPKMWEVVATNTKERSCYYEQQRTDPHYLHLSGGEYRFMQSEPVGIVADRMQRCTSVTSVKDLLLEVDEVLEYLKSHNGIVDQPINEDEHIVEDATRMQIDGDTNSTPAVRTAPDMRGGIPSATAIDTPTVVATPAMRLRMVQNILPNDSATKRTHNTTVQTWTYSPSIQGSETEPSGKPELKQQWCFNTNVRRLVRASPEPSLSKPH